MGRRFTRSREFARAALSDPARWGAVAGLVLTVGLGAADLVPPAEPGVVGCPQVVSVALALDDEWRDTFGPEATAQALKILDSASQLFEPLCLAFRPSEITVWDSQESATTITELHQAASDELREFQGQYMLVLTGSAMHGGLDGFASGAYAVVERHSEDERRDVAVIAHELGHLVGLRHHVLSCGCIMDRTGYATAWCPFHRALISRHPPSGGVLEILKQAHAAGSGSPPCS